MGEFLGNKYPPKKIWQQIQSCGNDVPFAAGNEFYSFGEMTGNSSSVLRRTTILADLKLIAYGVSISANSKTNTTNWKSRNGGIPISTIAIGAGMTGFFIKENISEEYVKGNQLNFQENPLDPVNTITIQAFTARFQEK